MKPLTKIVLTITIVALMLGLLLNYETKQAYTQFSHTLNPVQPNTQYPATQTATCRNMNGNVNDPVNSDPFIPLC